MKDYIKYGRLDLKAFEKHFTEVVGVVEAMANDMGGGVKRLEGMYKRSPDSTRAEGPRQATGCRRPAVCFAAELRRPSSRAAFYGDLTCSANGNCRGCSPD